MAGRALHAGGQLGHGDAVPSGRCGDGSDEPGWPTAENRSDSPPSLWSNPADGPVDRCKAARDRSTRTYAMGSTNSASNRLAPPSKQSGNSMSWARCPTNVAITVSVVGGSDPSLRLCACGFNFRDAVLAGLSRLDKAIPRRFLFDERGSALFEAVCTTLNTTFGGSRLGSSSRALMHHRPPR